jgi:hypothetical protein
MFSIDINGRIVVDPNTLTIPPVRKIWEADKSKNKDKALNILAAIYFFADPKSPYHNFPEKIKIEEIESQYGIKLNDPLIKETVELYKKLNITPSQFLLESFRELLFKLGDFIKRTPISAGKDGTITQLLNAMDKSSKTFAAYDSLKVAIEKEQLNSSKKIGQSKIGWNED